MEVCSDVINNETVSEKNDKSVDELKRKLKYQIDQLKSIIVQIEWSLNTITFKKVNCCFPSNIANDLNIPNISDVDAQLELELWKYSGLYCNQFLDKECIFNISSSYKCDTKNTFAVQILNDHNKVTLGKWVMPMGIDLSNVLSEVPINKGKDIPYFLRLCKHRINCYFIRHKQYTELMDIVSHTKYCNLNTNYGYTQMNLELLEVHNENTDSYLNIVIYLLYNANESRPHKIKVDSMTKDELDKSTRKHLESALECFKKFDLRTAFENMLNVKSFTWTKEDDEDSPLQIDTSSDTDEEGFLKEFLSVNNSQRRKRRVRKKRKIQSFITVDTHNSKSVSIKNRKPKLQNAELHSVSPQNIGVIKVTPHKNVKQKRLKQTKIEFQSNNLESQNNINTVVLSVTAPNNKEVGEQLKKPHTSTPIHQNGHSFKCNTSADIDISDITVVGSNSGSIKKKLT